jgi:hypothetical protein
LILLISNIANEAAPAWINSFPAGAVSLITASDFNLSFKAGIFVNDFFSSSLFINDRKIKPSDIGGVITTIPGFSPIEFYYINPADRDYVCTEVNSFINFFLSELKCKKINPPTRKSFSGLSCQKIEWVKIADKLNIPVQSFAVKNGDFEYPEKENKFKHFACTIINNQIMESEVNEKVYTYVRLLAKEFALPYLTCYFSTTDDKNFHLSELNSLPDISSSLYRDAMMNYFNS